MLNSILAEIGPKSPCTFAVDDAAPADPVVQAILREDMAPHHHPLELLAAWTHGLNRRATFGGLDRKVDALFRHGTVPGPLSGFHHGITVAMRLGLDALTGLSALGRRLRLGEAPDPLQLAFGLFLSRTNPWAGKSFAPLPAAELARWTESAAEGAGALLGSNRFRRLRGSVGSALSTRAIPWMLQVSPLPPPPPYAGSWLYAEGGAFIARRGRCVDPALAGKEVLDLNYRWRKLGNGAPPRLLRDQLVAVAPGIYLGKLYYATARLREEYDPRLPDEAYAYRCFGYFLLLDEAWRAEKDRLFPELSYPPL